MQRDVESPTLEITVPQTDRPVPLLARWLAQAALKRWPASAFHATGDDARTTSRDGYVAWRVATLRQQLLDHFDPALLAAADVLDFGSGRGELTQMLVRDFDVRQATGIELNPVGVHDARRFAAEQPEPIRDRLRYIHVDDATTIPLPDASVDLICCFDVVEHIPAIAATCREWRRVLRPGGRVWIWWSPWRGPYGHHVEALLPLPWIHLLLPARTIFAACAALYDHPRYEARVWDRDPVTGAKRENPWHAKRTYEPFLNRLTAGQFERTCRAAGLHIARHQAHGFSGSWKTRLTRPLRHLPAIGECFVSYHIYELGR